MQPQVRLCDMQESAMDYEVMYEDYVRVKKNLCDYLDGVRCTMGHKAKLIMHEYHLCTANAVHTNEKMYNMLQNGDANTADMNYYQHMFIICMKLKFKRHELKLELEQLRQVSELLAMYAQQVEQGKNVVMPLMKVLAEIKC